MVIKNETSKEKQLKKDEIRLFLLSLKNMCQANFLKKNINDYKHK